MLAIGDILNDTFRIKALIGQGGTACVYEVEHVRVPKRFALKVITGPSCSDPVFMQRFRQEAEILATLDHPHLVGLVDWNRSDQGLPYIVMELLIGEDLGHFLARTGALTPAVAMPIFVQVADALRGAHEHGIVHRDLKPGNIFLCKNGAFPNFVKVLDFGIAKSDRTSMPMQTDRTIVMGTPAYMAPEQARCGMEHVDTRTDQFALAAILYEMLSGQPAFYRRGDDAVATLVRVLTEDPPPLSYPHLDGAVRRALQKDKELRFACLADFVDATGVTERASVMRVLAVKPEPSAESAITQRVLAETESEAPAAPSEAPPRHPLPASLPSYAASAQLYPFRSPRRYPLAFRWLALPVALALVIGAHQVLRRPIKQGDKPAAATADSLGRRLEAQPQLSIAAAAPQLESLSLPAVSRQQPVPVDQDSRRGGPPASQTAPTETLAWADSAQPTELPESPEALEPNSQTPAEAPVDTPGEPEPPAASPKRISRHAVQGSNKAMRPRSLKPVASGSSAKQPELVASAEGIRRLTGVAEKLQADFIMRCGTKLAQERPDQVHGKILTISRCDPACVAPGGVDREVRIMLEKCLKQWHGLPFPAGNMKLFFH